MFKWMSPYYKEYKGLFAIDIGCAMLVALLDLAFPILSAQLLNEAVPERDLPLFFRLSIAMLLLYLVRAVSQFFVDYKGHVLGARVEYSMRRDFFGHLQKLPVRYFDDNRTGHIMSRTVNDLGEISELVHHGPTDVLSSLLIFSGSLIIMLNMHWQLALIAFSLVPIMFLISLSLRRKMRETFTKARIKVADVNAQVEDSISGVRVVKSFAREDYEECKFESSSRSYTDIREKTAVLLGLFNSGVDLFSNLVNLAVVVFGSYFIYTGSLSLGFFLAFLLYVRIFFQPVRRLMLLVENFQKGMAGLRRFAEVMELSPDIADAPDAIDLQHPQGQIIFEDVSFSYDEEQRVLQHINLKIEPGETVALVGPSGSGKSTLCNLIPRFYEVEAGAIYLDGIDIRRLTQHSLRRHIGLVEQDVFLFTGSIRDNIAYGRGDASFDEIVEAAIRANAHEFILSLPLGYDSDVGERGVKLSGGQKQRISIARAFLKDPPVLILDEATSALDTETEGIVQEALYELSQSRTTLVIAHRLSTIRNADRILVLTEEGIAESGSHEELMEKDGYYKKLYLAQFYHQEEGLEEGFKQ